VYLLKKTIDAYRREGLKEALYKIARRLNTARKIAGLNVKLQKKRWRKLKGAYEGERIFVIGNGPSLNKTPLYLLENEYKMCFNRFSVMEERLPWTPDFFLTTDDLVLSDIAKEFDKIIPKTTYSFFPGIHFHGQVYANELDKYTNAFWTIPKLGLGFSDALPYIYPGHTVIYDSFQILKYMGFEEIYLLGVDFNYSIHNSVKILKKNTVDIISTKDDDPNHFDPRYFGKGRKYHQPEEFVINNMIKDMEYLANNIITEDFRIINAGFDSKLNSFPRVDFKSVINPSTIEMERIFSNLRESVCNKNGLSKSDIENIPFLNEGDKYQNVDDSSFITSINIGLSLIQSKIFTHIPLGPYDGKYYFIKRTSEENDT
jgi:hypothetical protein